jgi:hypothetical protein
MKKVIRLTESDLVRIVRKFIKEGVIVTVPPQPWNTLDTMIGEVVWTNDGGKTLNVRGYDENGIDYSENIHTVNKEDFTLSFNFCPCYGVARKE